ncbi:hypothetical protein ACO0QE_004361 [Hanseniaspora vineae]
MTSAKMISHKTASTAHSMNVLVYNGEGASPVCVQHTVNTLKYLLEPHYAVTTVSNKALLTEPWMTKTSALVFPGGADLPYTKDCKPVISEIQKFVKKKGGLFVGICAGGYFGTSRCEFYLNHPTMEVSGNRDLKFYPGVARGPTFPGFQYKSQSGARVVTLDVDNGTKVKSYYNGGASFISPESFDNVEVLARYCDEKNDMLVETLNENEKSRDAAVVLCTNGNGKALLIGAHPEYVPELMVRSKEEGHYDEKLLKELASGNQNRKEFLRYIFSKAGLKVNHVDSETGVTPLTPMYISVDKIPSEKLKEFKAHLTPNLIDSDHYHVKDNADEFDIYEGYANPKVKPFTSSPLDSTYSEPKVIVLPTDGESCVPFEKTPKFDVAKFFKHRWPTTEYGSILLYGEVVTSTSGILDSDKTLLSMLPQNSVVFLGTKQVLGRGRGGNVWVNPDGCLGATISVSFPLKSSATGNPSSIAFVQYLSSLALCKTVKNYAKGYENIPIKIKWPNDLYIVDPDYYFDKKLNIFDLKSVPLNDIEQPYVKTAGTMINTHFINGAYNVLIGTGLNATNDAPSVSVQMWADIINEEMKKRKDFDEKNLLPPLEHEKLLALYVNYLNAFINSFMENGSKSILSEYYEHWLHSSQIITLTDHSVRAKIVGITEDYGLLIAKELRAGSNDAFTGNVYHLQPDGNTFDIFRGLISKKIYH